MLPGSAVVLRLRMREEPRVAARVAAAWRGVPAAAAVAAGLGLVFSLAIEPECTPFYLIAGIPAWALLGWAFRLERGPRVVTSLPALGLALGTAIGTIVEFRSPGYNNPDAWLKGLWVFMCGGVGYGAGTVLMLAGLAGIIIVRAIRDRRISIRALMALIALLAVAFALLGWFGLRG
jgi:hypothetical protein